MSMDDQHDDQGVEELEGEATGSVPFEDDDYEAGVEEAKKLAEE